MLEVLKVKLFYESNHLKLYSYDFEQSVGQYLFTVVDLYITEITVTFEILLNNRIDSLAIYS